MIANGRKRFHGKSRNQNEADSHAAIAHGADARCTSGAAMGRNSQTAGLIKREQRDHPQHLAVLDQRQPAIVQNLLPAILVSAGDFLDQEWAAKFSQ